MVAKMAENFAARISKYVRNGTGGGFNKTRILVKKNW